MLLALGKFLLMGLGIGAAVSLFAMVAWSAMGEVLDNADTKTGRII